MMTDTSPDRHDPYAALKVPEFRFFLGERMCLTLATQIEAVIVGWQVYEITQDPLSLGMIGLTEAIPSILVALYAGHVADIMSRRKIILTCLSAMFACSLGLLLCTPGVSDGVITPAIIPAFTPDMNDKTLLVLPIYVLIFFIGIARGFMGPAHFAFLPQLVSKEIFSNAITWNSTNWQTAAVAGPALGGLLYGFFGISITYGVQCVLVATALLFCLMIKSKPVPEYKGDERLVDRLSVGIKFVFNNQLVVSAISLDLFAVLFGGAVALLPAFASDILHVGAEGLGLLRAAPAIGSVAMALVLAHAPMRKNAGAILFYCVAGFGVCMIVFGLSENFWLSLFALVMSGVFDSVSVIIRSTLLQTLTPDHMKGRVSAVNNIFIGSSNEIGAFESGVAARFMGLVPSVVFGGIMTLVVVGVTALRAEKLRKLDL